MAIQSPQINPERVVFVVRTFIDPPEREEEQLPEMEIASRHLRRCACPALTGRWIGRLRVSYDVQSQGIMMISAASSSANPI